MTRNLEFLLFLWLQKKKKNDVVLLERATASSVTNGRVSSIESKNSSFESKNSSIEFKNSSIESKISSFESKNSSSNIIWTRV